MKMNLFLGLMLALIATWFVDYSTAVLAVLSMKQNHFDETDTHLERVKREVDAIATHIKPEITKLHIKSSVTSRFSSTTVTSILSNHADNNAAEAVFLFTLPGEAFIANFSMEIDGVVYPAEIKEKEVATHLYQEARSKGQSAAHVKQKSENDFTVSVNVAKKNSVTFELIYQEMLRRKHGYFEHRTSISPGQIVKKMRVEVVIIEIQGLLEVNSSWVERQDKENEMTKYNVGEIQLKRRNTTAFVKYAPTIEEQRQQSEDGIHGDFVIWYDVAHPKNGGELQIVNGYFVHYFSPEGLPVVRKNVVFVIDVSGSMYGRKIQQTKQAMYTILDDLREVDFFNIVKFSGNTRKWQDNLKQASPENIGNGKNFIESFGAKGATNLHRGLMDGIELLHTDSENNGVSMVILLTDGLPTSGVTSFGRIQTDVKQAIKGNCSLFIIGFGDDVDYPFLEKLALQNDGLARKIYDDSFASIQLKGFFDEVSTPLLHNIVFNYSEDFVELNSVTQTTFPNYFQGTEIVVSGKLKAKTDSGILDVTIAANSVDVTLEFPLRINTEPKEDLLNNHTVDDFAKRLWAYLSIKELLQKRNISENDVERDKLKENALQLSLEYHFVTPLTSLIVIKPEQTFFSDVDKIVQPTSSGTDTKTNRKYYGRRTSGSKRARYLLPPGANFLLSKPSSSHGSGPYGSGSQHYAHAFDFDPCNYHPCGNNSFCINKVDGFICICDPGYSGNPCQQKATIQTIQETTTIQTTQITTTSEPTQETSRPKLTANSRTTKETSVGDNQYLVRIPNSNLYVCFNIESYPGDAYRLIQDPKQGIKVTGTLIVESHYQNAEHRPLLREIHLKYRNRTIVVTPSYAKLHEVVIRWQNINWLGDQYLSLIRENDQVRVMIGTDITLVIMRHRYPRGSSNQVYYLGLYVDVGRGFSDDVHGLIGQFYNRNRRIRLNNVHFDKPAIKGTLYVNSRQVPVTLEYADEAGPGTKQTRQCWFADNNGMGLIDGWHGDYLDK